MIRIRVGQGVGGSFPVEAGHVAHDAGVVLEAALGGEHGAVTLELVHPDPPGRRAGAARPLVRHHGQPGGEVGEGRVDDVLGVQGAAQGGQAAARHTPGHLNIIFEKITEILPMKPDLNIFSVAVSILIGVLQLECLKVDPNLWTSSYYLDEHQLKTCHLTDVVVNRRYEEAADGGQGPGAGADEVCPVLLGGGVAGLGEAAAHSKPLGAASISHPALGGALVTSKAGAWKNKMSMK